MRQREWLHSATIQVDADTLSASQDPVFDLPAPHGSVKLHDILLHLAWWPVRHSEQH